jgi:hypothetical protein
MKKLVPAMDKALHPYSTRSPRRTGAAVLDDAIDGEPLFVAITACQLAGREAADIKLFLLCFIKGV